jgi:microcin C transport system substrate-binding protein
VGRNNFKEVQYDYYRDDTVMLEAFKAGEFDLRTENSAKFWANSYTGANFDKGYIVKKRSTMRSLKRLKVLSSIFNLQCSLILKFVKR